ncbi:MAG: FAD-dependent oxidoreductase [Clostridia bacterium]|nr:FAD-dependent oxidoreductase [Clostridia bacterium]
MKTKYDLIVVGGGFAGTAAAIEAARQGTDVLLIEKYNCLGGAAAYALVSPFMAFWTHIGEDKKRQNLAGDLFLEIVDEAMKLTARSEDTPMIRDALFDEESMKLAMLRMARKAGVTLLFNTAVTAVTREKGTLRSVKAICKAIDMEFFADHFIDATGDAELSYLAGCTCEVGREGDGQCQPMTLCFRVGGIDKEKFTADRARMQALYKQWQADGRIKNPRENVLVFRNYNEGVMHFNTTRVIKKSPVDPFALTEAEIEAREQTYEMMHFLRSAVEGCENARLLSTALHIGIRESRRVMGEYVLCEEDLIALRRFEDAIAAANYAIDIHSPDGSGTRFQEFSDGEWYEIPYRALLPKGFDNLLVAGRCISSTHEAQASYRIMPFCAELGQAAGCAVAVAKRSGRNARTVNVKDVQAILRTKGFVI